MGTLELRPLGEVVHFTKVGEVIPFDFLLIGTGWLFGDNSISFDTSEDLPAPVEGVSGNTWLDLAAVLTTVVTAETLLRW